MYNRPYSRHLCTRLWTDEIKAGKKLIKFAITGNRGDFSILDNIIWITFYLKDDKGKFWLEVIIVTFKNALATVDVLKASNKDTKLVESPICHFAWLVNRRPVLREKTSSTVIIHIGKFYNLIAPWNTTWHCFYPINPKARAKMADIVNKVIVLVLTSSWHFVESQK